MWIFFVSFRYLTAKRREKFISIISTISILGVAVGVAALIIVISVMTGFDDEIKEKIIGTYAHIIITRENGIPDPESVIKILKEDKNILAASSFMEKQALLRVGKNIIGVILRGIDEENESSTTNIRQFTSKGVFDFGKNNIILGSELKKSLRLSFGDTVEVISPGINKTEKFIVSDVFSSGRYDYDANMICISLDKAKSLFKNNNVTGVGLKVKDEYDVRKMRGQLVKKLGYPYFVRTWMDLDKNLMKALSMEKKMMFFILGLIVIVACFNISSSLIMMVMEKTKDIGILRSIGATSYHIGFIFLLEGLFIGLIGTGIGACLGIFIAKNVNSIADTIERVTGLAVFPSDIYYLSSIPAKIDLADITTIVGFAIGLVVISGLYPAFQAARLDPVEAIRYE